MRYVNASAGRTGSDVNSVISTAHFHRNNCSRLRRVGQAHGEGHSALFLANVVRGEGDGGGIDGIADGRRRGRTAVVHRLEVAAGDAGYLACQRARVNVRIFTIRIGHVNDSADRTGRDVNSVISTARVHRNNRSRLRRVGQANGKDHSAFSFANVARRESGCGGVDGIADCRRCGRTSVIHRLEVAAGDAGNRACQRAFVEIHIFCIRIGHINASACRAGRDVHGVISAAHVHRNNRSRLRRAGQVDSEGDAIPALFNVSCKDGNDSVGIVNRRSCGRIAVVHRFEVAAGDADNRGAQLAWYEVRIGHTQGSITFACRNCNAVFFSIHVQLRHSIRLRCIGQADGKVDAIFILINVGRGKGDCGGVDGIADGRRHGRTAIVHCLEVAAGDAGYRACQRARVSVGIITIRIGHVNASTGRAGRDVHGVISAAHVHRNNCIRLHCVRQGNGKGHMRVTLFNIAGGKSDCGGVNSIADGRCCGCTAVVHRLEVAAGDTGDSCRQRAFVEICILYVRIGHVNASAGRSGGDADGICLASCVHRCRCIRLCCIGQADGKSHIRFAFFDIGCGEGNDGGINGIRNVCCCARTGEIHTIKTAARNTFDGGRQTICIDVRILSVVICNTDTARFSPGWDGNGITVFAHLKRDNGVSPCRSGQRCGKGDLCVRLGNVCRLQAELCGDHRFRNRLFQAELCGDRRFRNCLFQVQRFGRIQNEAHLFAFVGTCTVHNRVMFAGNNDAVCLVTISKVDPVAVIIDHDDTAKIIQPDDVQSIVGVGRFHVLGKRSIHHRAI